MFGQHIPPEELVRKIYKLAGDIPGVSIRNRLWEEGLEPFEDAVPDHFTPDDIWIAREATRLCVDAEFKPPHFVFEGWFKDAPVEVKRTFPRVVVEDEARVGYIPDEDKAREDRPTVCKVGKWVSKAVQPYMDVPHELVERIAREHRERHDPPTIKWATSGADIAHVYENGPSSCMSKPAVEFTTPCHPVEAYGQDRGSDLAVAYLERDRGGGLEITARALVYPERAVWMMHYGDSTLIRMLQEDLGYRYDPDGFVGARVARIEVNDSWILPYIGKDGDGTFGVEVNDQNTLLLTSGDDGDVVAASQNGRVGPAPRCDECGDPLDPEDSVAMYDGDFEVCDSCSLRSVEAEAERGTVRVWESDSNIIEASDGRMFWCESAAEHHGYRECDECGEWHHSEYMVEAEDDGTTLHENEVDYVIKDSNGGIIPLAGEPDTDQYEAVEDDCATYPNATVYVERETETEEAE